MFYCYLKSKEVLDFNNICNFIDMTDNKYFIFKNNKENEIQMILGVVPIENIEYILDNSIVSQNQK